MNLPIPVVGVDPGPDYALNVDACLAIIDSHNHASGNGVQINPGGLNINSDLPMNGNNLTTIRSLRFSPQSSPLSLGSDLGCLYESGVDLYYNDGNGNPIQITSGGGVAGSPGSIGSLTPPASASYSSGSKSFIWQSGTNKAAAMDNGAVTIRETDVTSAKGITLASPSALGADYQLTLMSGLPAQQNVMTVDNTGVVSNVTWNDVANNRTRSTGTTVAVGGVAISGSSGVFSNATTTMMDVTNLSVTITTSGRPVVVALMGNTSGGYVGITTASSAGPTAFFQVVRGVTAIALFDASTVTSGQVFVPCGSVSCVDVVGAGTYTYKLQIATASNIGTDAVVGNSQLIAYEL